MILVGKKLHKSSPDHCLELAGRLPNPLFTSRSTCELLGNYCTTNPVFWP